MDLYYLFQSRIHPVSDFHAPEDLHQWCFNPVFIRSLIFTADRSWSIHVHPWVFQSRIHPVSDFHGLSHPFIHEDCFNPVFIRSLIFTKRIFPSVIMAFTSCFNPVFIRSLIFTGIMTRPTYFQEMKVFQSRIHPVSDFHTNPQLSRPSRLRCFNPVFIRSLIFTFQDGSMKRVTILFQSRIHPVSDFHPRLFLFNNIEQFTHAFR